MERCCLMDLPVLEQQEEEEEEEAIVFSIIMQYKNLESPKVILGEYTPPLRANAPGPDALTDVHHDVEPKPGHSVIMDQYIPYSVVGPKEEGVSGKCPKCMLVWKLILHPVREAQE
eukprot:7878012-Ditylum_brightwellii.AAC.1